MQAKKHISPRLVKLAAESGIGVKIIDIDKPFEEQEPFDVLLHKVRSPGECRRLKTALLCLFGSAVLNGKSGIIHE